MLPSPRPLWLLFSLSQPDQWFVTDFASRLALLRAEMQSRQLQEIGTRCFSVNHSHRLFGHDVVEITVFAPSVVPTACLTSMIADGEAGSEATARALQATFSSCQSGEERLRLASALLGCGVFQTSGGGLGSGHLCLAEALLDVCCKQARVPAQLATVLLLWLLARPCTTDPCSGLLPPCEWVRLALAACGALAPPVSSSPAPMTTADDLRDSVLHRLAQFRLLASREPVTPAWAVLWLLWHANCPVPSLAWPAPCPAPAGWELCRTLSAASGLPWAEATRPSALDTALGWLRQTSASAAPPVADRPAEAVVVVRGALSPSCGWGTAERPWLGEPRHWEPAPAVVCEGRRPAPNRDDFAADARWFARHLSWYPANASAQDVDALFELALLVACCRKQFLPKLPNTKLFTSLAEVWQRAAWLNSDGQLDLALAPPCRFWLRLAGSLEKANASSSQPTISAKQLAAHIAGKGPCRRWLYNHWLQRQPCLSGEGRDAGLVLLWLRTRVAHARLGRDGQRLTLWAPTKAEHVLSLVRALGLGDRDQVPDVGALARLQCARRDSAPENSRFPSWPLPRTVEGWGEGAFTWGHLLQSEAGQMSLDWTLAGRAAQRAWWSAFWQLQAIDGVRTLVLTPAQPAVEWLARVHPCFTPAGLFVPGPGPPLPKLVVLGPPIAYWQEHHEGPTVVTGAREISATLRASRLVIWTGPSAAPDLLDRLDFGRVVLDGEQLPAPPPGAWGARRHVVTYSTGDAICRAQPWTQYQPSPLHLWGSLHVSYRRLSGKGSRPLLARIARLQATGPPRAAGVLARAVRALWRGRFWRACGDRCGDTAVALRRGWLVALDDRVWRTPALYQLCLLELGRAARLNGGLRLAARTCVVLVRPAQTPGRQTAPVPGAKRRLLVCEVEIGAGLRWWPAEPDPGQLARYWWLHLVLEPPLQPGCQELRLAWTLLPPALRAALPDAAHGQVSQLEVWHV